MDSIWHDRSRRAAPAHGLHVALLVLVLCVGTHRALAAGARKAGAESAEITKGTATLSEAQRTLAKERFPKLLDIRDEVDEIYGKYREMVLAKGVSRRRKADRYLPKADAMLEDALEELEERYERDSAPLRKERNELKDEEADLLEKMDKVEFGSRRADRLQEELDEVGEELSELEQAIELAKALGEPDCETGNPERLLLMETVRLSERQEKDLAGLTKTNRDLVPARLLIVHAKADLERAEAKAEESGSRSDHAKIKGRERDVQKAGESFTEVMEPILEEMQEEYEDITDDMERLAPKLERSRGRASGRRYQEDMNRMEARRKNLGDRMKLLQTLAKGTAAESLWKEKDEGNGRK